MKILLLAFISVLPLVSSGLEELEYFQEKHDKSFEGINPLDTYKDPDQFYTAIAKNLGVHTIAFDAVRNEYGWEKKENEIFQAIVRRSTGLWVIMVYRLEFSPETKKTKMESMVTRWVKIDDELKVIYCGKEQNETNNQNKSVDVTP
ncbi:hypothetical protein [Cerasicoccus arenae]|uniref:Uncharacterized protein n=1 Tax=Cerasicoccus arenae TaxID=424488 RepID=A0A8J3DFT5_9BACT|nr:hypothetical protein [Cerasicoccus arenae]MBK1859793.1 hypothetical protein [Cerasicoccus arenae]GHB93775.1 hypothetical protein GCM10007047_06630 [Cerasicoccus arenae]